MDAQEHYAEAERLVESEAAAYALTDPACLALQVRALVHATLASGASGGESLAKYLTLRAAVREHLIARDTPPYMDEMTIARLRDLVGGA